MSAASSRNSLQRRAAIAVLLLVGFYVLALGVSALLIASIIAQFASGHVYLKLVIVAGIAAVAILAGIFPRVDRFDPPWPRLREDDQPELFRALKTVAAEAGQEMPGEVYLIPDLNAWVASRGGVMGIGSRRVMAIGLPLLHLLDARQLCAVLAHEFGHYHGGDTSLGPWIYKTRGAIGRTLQHLNETGPGVLRAPFELYGKMFLRITHGISRHQEYTADRFAAGIAGPSALVGALERLAGYGPGIDAYWNSLVLPSLGAGYRPPIGAGLGRLVNSPRAAESAAAIVERTMQEEKEAPYDTHPPLRERIAALGAVAPDAAAESAPAIRLLRDADELERLLLASFLTPEGLFNLKQIAWCDVGAKVFVANWQLWRTNNAATLAPWSVARLSELFASGGAVARLLVDAEGKAPASSERVNFLLHALVACVGLSMVEAGWEFVADPEPGATHLSRAGRGADPVSLVVGLARGEIGANRWNELCVELGIDRAMLAGGASAPAAALVPHGESQRRFVAYRITVEEGGAPATLITLLSPDDSYLIGGLPPETIVGKLLSADADLSPTNFIRNAAFVDFMHGVIARAAPEIGEYSAAARAQGEGLLHVHDARAHATDADAAQRDIIGSFRVAQGKIVDGSYTPNPNHRVVSEYGLFAPHPVLQEQLLSALRALRHDPAA